jgi:hypothetical protein
MASKPIAKTGHCDTPHRRRQLLPVARGRALPEMRFTA